MRVVVYTCITGGYDKLWPIDYPNPDIDFVCFTDANIKPSKGWVLRQLPSSQLRGADINRFIKMNPHVFFPDYDFSVYIDGSIAVVGSVKKFLMPFLRECYIAIYRHPFRDCIYKEAVECSKIGFDWYWRIHKQMQKYRKYGFGEGMGLYEATIIVRKHNDVAVIKAMSMWWKEYSTGVKRDQLSLPYILAASNIHVCNLGFPDYRGEFRYFRMFSHVAKPSILRRFKGLVNRAICRYVSP